jgi:pantetheine-phosphate adenylyltransferase
MRTAIYPLSADPITFGHIDIIERALKVFDRLVVAIGQNSNKKYLFSLEERAKIAKKVLEKYENLEVIGFDNLLTDLVKQKNIYCIVRGVRNSNDYLNEVNLYQNYLSQEQNLEFINLFSNQHFISSSSVKEVVSLQGDVSKSVPILVKKELENKILEQNIVAITGVIGSGKTFFGEQFLSLNKDFSKKTRVLDVNKKLNQIGLEFGEKFLKEVIKFQFLKKDTNLEKIFEHNCLNHKQVHFFSFDQINQNILQNLNSYPNLYEKFYRVFGKKVFVDKNSIDKQKLSRIVFKNKTKLKELEQILHPQILYIFREKIKGLKGLILVENPLLAEKSLEYLSNNQIIFVKNDQKNQSWRLKKRGWSEKEINSRLKNQLDEKSKLQKIMQKITEENFGNLWIV